jgi:pyruvate,water dikinase
MGVVVQRMVPAEAAGVMLTIDPVTGDRSAIVIEAAYGLDDLRVA